LSAPRNLVIATTGADDTTHKEWIAGARDFDLMLVNYGVPGRYAEDADFFLDASGFKYEITKDAIDHYRDLVMSYDVIWTPDDDLSVSTDGINQLFAVFHEFRLDLAQPAMVEANFPVHYPHPFTRLRYVAFVEIGLTLFRQSVLCELLDTFKLTRSGWGLDLLWAQRLLGRRVAVIDEVIVRHMRPCDLENGSYYRKLRGLGIDAREEMEALIDQYNLRTTITARQFGGEYASTRHALAGRAFQNLRWGVVRSLWNKIPSRIARVIGNQT